MINNINGLLVLFSSKLTLSLEIHLLSAAAAPEKWGFCF